MLGPAMKRMALPKISLSGIEHAAFHKGSIVQAAGEMGQVFFQTMTLLVWKGSPPGLKGCSIASWPSSTLPRVSSAILLAEEYASFVLPFY